jgi:tetratricopeptide (TPR) repeat protein/S1-C subfamily serine protease
MKHLNLTFIPILTTLLLLPHTATFSTPTPSNKVSSTLIASNLSTTEIKQIAQAVTVRIFTNKRGGSGVLVGKQGQTYTVLTNAHVVNAKGSYTIQTPDGKTRQAVVKYRGDSLKGNDLALLEFTSTNNYRIAELATDTDSIENQEVYASGFPYDTQRFTFTTGKISLISDRPFIGGYQIGYSNEIKQGMSGGALLNEKGQLIGINGLAKYPILSDTFTYQDGSCPSEKLRQQLQKLSFAVPIKTLVKIAPQLASRPSNNTNKSPIVNSSSNSPKLTGLPAEIDAVAQQITVRIDSKNRGNGSGVIMARQGQTYYILTAFHVVEKPDEYTVITPDGQKYPIKPNDIVKENGLDVAILKFTSQQTYQIATLARYNLSDNQEHWIFFSGFPAATEGKRQFNPGFRFSREQGFFQTKDTVSQLSNGYELVFTNQSSPGMSGGALLDLKGRVIGIGGRQEGEEYSTKTQRYLGYAFGVPITTVLGLATKAGIKPEWMQIETTQPPSSNISQASEMLEQPAFAVEKPSADADENSWLNYGNQLWRLRKSDEAVAALQQAIEKNSEFYQAYYVLGLVQQSQRKYDEAVATFERVTKLNPDYYQAWWQQSNILVFKKKYPEALAAVNKAIELNSQQASNDRPKDFILYINKGNILYQLKRYQEAEVAFTEAIKLKPSELAYVNRGAVRTQLKQYSEAIADYNRAIAINPQYSEAYVNRGVVHEELKQYSEAITDYNRAIAINPQLAETYYNRGNVRKELKQYSEAIADYTKAIAINPQYALAYNNRGLVREELKQYLEAIADYTEAIKINPQLALPYNNRGNLRAELKQYPEALADYSKAIEINPQYAEAYGNRGFVHTQLKQYPEALADYSKAIEINPQYALAYNNRGLVREELKQYLEAIADYTEAIKINPQDAFAFGSRGLVREELKQYLEAIADYTEAIKINPQDAFAFGSRGLVRYKLKDNRGAIADLQTAAKLFEQQGNPELSQTIQQALRELQSSP